MQLPPKPTKKEIVTEFRTREILAAARSLMQSRGVEAVTMEEIALAAGVAKGTVYLYFHGKEDLIQALMSLVGENLIQDLEARLAQAGSTGEKLNVWVTGLLKFVEEERFLFPFYVRDVIRGTVSEHESLAREVEARLMALLSRFFAEGMQVGEFIPADPRLLSYLLRGLVRAVGYYQMTQSQQDTVGEALPVVKTLLSSGLLARPRSEVDDVVEI